MRSSRRRRSDSAPFERLKDHLLFVVLILVGASLLLFVGDRRQLFSGRSLSIYQKLISNLSAIVKDKIDSVNTLSSLRTEHEALLEQIAAQELIARDPTSTYNQLRTLQAVVNFQEQLRFTNVVAEIVAKDPNQYYSSFVINKGSRHALATDMVVVAIQEGKVGLVGRLHTVHNNSATIQTILDQRSYVTTKIEKNQLTGITRGSANPPGSSTEQHISMHLTDGRDSDQIEFGDLIVTSGFSSVYYPNIPVGTVTEVRSRNYEQTLRIDLEPTINFNTLQYVFVLIPRTF